MCSSTAGRTRGAQGGWFRPQSAHQALSTLSAASLKTKEFEEVDCPAPASQAPLETEMQLWRERLLPSEKAAAEESAGYEWEEEARVFSSERPGTLASLESQLPGL